MTPIPRAVLPRFWERIDKTDLNGCWLWAPPLAVNGYGEISVNGVQTLAHRVAYEMFIGSIPPTLTIDHTCHNADPACTGGDGCPHRACVNPLHLEAVPLEVNIQRAWARKDSPTCPRGHYWTPENTGPAQGGRYRRCRTCHRERERARLRAKKARPTARTTDLQGVSA